MVRRGPGARGFLILGGPLIGTAVFPCRLSALARVCGHGDHKQKMYHSGAFVSNQWTWYDATAVVVQTCNDVMVMSYFSSCGGITEDPKLGCQPLTL